MPIGKKERDEMQTVMASLCNHVFKGYGVALMVFEADQPGGAIQWVSNASRESMIAALKEFIARNEKP